MGISHNSIEIFEAELPDLLIQALGEWGDGQDQTTEQDAFNAYKRTMRELCILLWGCSQAAQVLMLLKGIFPLGTLFVLNAGWKILLSSPWRQQIVTKCFSLISLSGSCPINIGRLGVVADPQVEDDELRMYINHILEPKVSLFSFAPRNRFGSTG
jgi:hypothetical protein